MEGRKFKVGDLVKVVGIDGFSFYMDMKDGDCAIIIDVLPPPTTNSVYSEGFFFDYRILVNDHEFYIFEDELRPYEDSSFCESCECDPCDCHWGIE